jgi:hypothetical protein
MLKWGTLEESQQAAERLNGIMTKVMGSKTLYMLMVLAAFLLLSGASEKWAG